MDKLANYLSILKRAGMRITPQRIAICEILVDSHEHPTANMVYHVLRQKYPTVSLATVYNTLEALASLGAIGRLGSMGDNAAHYDGDSSPHVNLSCVSCKKIIDVDIPQLTSLDGQLAVETGYLILGSSLLYNGMCPDCQNSTQLHKEL